MYQNNDKISSSHLIHIMILNMVGVGILTLPRELVEAVKNDGWILLIFGGIITMIFSTLHGYIIKSFPGKSFLYITSNTLTKPLGYVVLFYFTIYFIGILGLVTRFFTEVVHVFMLERTPKHFIILCILLVAVYSSRKGIETLGRMAEFLMIPLFLVILLIFSFSWQNFRIDNILPVFQTPFKDIIKAIPLAFLSLLGFEILLVFGMFLNKTEKTVLLGPKAIFTVLIFYLILNATVLGNFGEEQIKRLIWPFLSNFETIQLPGGFVENINFLVMSLWIITVFMTIAPMYLAANILTCQLLGAREHQYLSLVLLPFIYFISIWNDNISDAYETLDKFINYTVYGVIIIIPVVIFFLILVKRNARQKT